MRQSIFILIIMMVNVSCRYAEVLLLVMFILLVLLWFTRDPKFIPGWSSLFRSQDGGAR